MQLKSSSHVAHHSPSHLHYWLLRYELHHYYSISTTPDQLFELLLWTCDWSTSANQTNAQLVSLTSLAPSGLLRSVLKSCRWPLGNANSSLRFAILITPPYRIALAKFHHGHGTLRAWRPFRRLGNDISSQRLAFLFLTLAGHLKLSQKMHCLEFVNFHMSIVFLIRSAGRSW